MPNKSCEFQRSPGRRGAPSSPTCPPARSPLPRHSHLQRTVGSIDEAKVLGLRQDHEGTLLMALRGRDRGGGEQTGCRAGAGQTGGRTRSYTGCTTLMAAPGRSLAAPTRPLVKPCPGRGPRHHRSGPYLATSQVEGSVLVLIQHSKVCLPPIQQKLCKGKGAED